MKYITLETAKIKLKSHCFDDDPGPSDAHVVEACKKARMEHLRHGWMPEPASFGFLYIPSHLINNRFYAPLRNQLGHAHNQPNVIPDFNPVPSKLKHV